MSRKLFLTAALLLASLLSAWPIVIAGWRPVHANAQSVPSVTQTTPAPQWTAAVDRARQLIRETLARENVPGLSIAVGTAGNLVWAEGFGWSHLAQAVPVTPDTRFHLGTASAPLTAAAARLLIEGGNLNPDRDIREQVPQFPQTKWPITLRHLMANQSGLAMDDDDGPLFRQRCQQPAEALSHAAQTEQPGTQHRPSNYNWIAVSAAIEAAAKQPFLQFMDEQIFRPLGMTNTGAESADKENPERIGEPEEDAPIFTLVRQVLLQPIGVAKPAPKSETASATLYLPGFGPSPHLGHGLHEMRVGNLSCYAGSMAFFSTPSDMVRFGLGARPEPLASHDGELRGHRIVSMKISQAPGLVVVIMANHPSAGTPTLARKIAEVFATPPR